MNTGLKNFLSEQMPAMPPQGGPPQGGPPGAGGMSKMPKQTVADKVWAQVTQNPNIDEFIQMMQMEGYTDRIILKRIREKFYPEFIYWAKEAIRQTNKQKAPQQRMPGQAADVDLFGGGHELGGGGPSG